MVDDRWQPVVTLESSPPLEVVLATSTTLFVRRKGVEEKDDNDDDTQLLQSMILEVVQRVLDHHDTSDVSARDLLILGAVWLWQRAWRRLSWNDRSILFTTAHSVLRIHTQPTRYSMEGLKVVVTSSMYILVNKPGGLPAHATVDNGVENVLHQVRDISSYATLPHRLDVDTSGLQLVATAKNFASYFGRLLEQKTVGGDNNSSLKKRYKCLVRAKSVEEYLKIQDYQRSHATISHYMNPSDKCPKRFVEAKPKEDDTWLVCHLKILQVGRLIKASSCMSNGCIKSNIHSHPFITELTIDLLTGRTHQIRGQLAALKCPIVGDNVYGAVSDSSHEENGVASDTSTASDRAMDKPSNDAQDVDFLFPKQRRPNAMALQCCYLAFEAPKEFDESGAIAGDKNEGCAMHRGNILTTGDSVGATYINPPFTTASMTKAQLKKQRKLKKLQINKLRRQGLVGSGEMVEYELESAWWTEALLKAEAVAVDVDKGLTHESCESEDAKKLALWWWRQ